MKNVMTKAWEIAKEGQKRFGGQVKEYFAEALKMAWALVKKGIKTMSKYPAIVAKRAEELFETGDQPLRQYAKNKAEYEFDVLLSDLKKVNTAKAKKGGKTMSVETFMQSIENVTLDQYSKIKMKASHAAKYL